MKRIPSNALFFLSLLAISTASQAQISFGGHPLGIDRSNALPEAPIVTMPAVDAEAMKTEDIEIAKDGKPRPYRFGYNHYVDLGLENSGVWHTLPSGDRVWRLAIECPEAYSINFEFHDYVVPDGAQVFVYNDAGDVLGSFEEGSNPGHTSLGVDLMQGDRITVEYVEPASVRGLGRLRIGQVTHAYRNMFKDGNDLGESGSCNNNVICAVGDPWRDQIRSVAMIVVGGSGSCTGQLINNCSSDGTPYFLTANHCLGSPNNWIFRFGWESPSCSQNISGPTNRTVAGSTLLVNSAASDVALLELNSTPPASYDVFYTGWDRSTSAPSNGTCIHHPRGDIKKISFENQALTSGNFQGAQCWNVAQWNDGTTEGGSSGSGIWNSDKRLVGQLFGGAANCQFNFDDYFGKFSVSYPLLEPFLGSCGTTLDGFPEVVGIDEAFAAGGLVLSPNPSTGRVMIDLPASQQGTLSIEVLDALGKLVQQRSIQAGGQQVQLDLSAVPDGMYSVRVGTVQGRYVQRLIVAH